MTRPLVSVLIPYKNTSTYLKECLDSILAQTYTNWEVIAIDDNSTDDSLKIVTNFGEQDSRIKTYPNQGSGIIPALRTAYTKSKGHLITRMDSDDIMQPSRVQQMVKDLNLNGIGHLSVGQVRYFSERGISNGYERYEQWLNGLTTMGTNFSELYKECVVPSPCWMLHRSDLDACNAFEPERYPEDYDLTFRFYEIGLKIIPCSEVLLLWRDYDSRTSRTSAHYAQNYFLEIKLHYFLKLHYDQNKSLIIWGAGKKGKQMAQLLQNEGIHFTWVCDNPKKIGKEIYEVPLISFHKLKDIDDFQSIITVANAEEQNTMRKYLSHLGKSNMVDYFFFC
ncbi:glycosyltransferase [Maribacter chungangensis]|uniref:Glycosyltransferase n=1 Tax=Maribacter chungangensis TaxID=1069117 RepID=A0ABW3B8L7_9FLAO